MKRKQPLDGRFRRLISPDLLEDGVFRSLICFMIPIFVSYLFQQLYNTVDTIIVGYFLQEGSLAAVGSCSAIFELVLSLGNGFGTYIIAGHIAARKVFMLFVELIFSIGVAISTFVSQNFGAGRLDRVRKGVRGQISSFR